MSRQTRGAALRNSSLPPSTVLFFDDFDGAAGGPPNPARWHRDTGRGYYDGGVFVYGWGGNDAQYFTEDAAVLDGASNLAITCSRTAPPDFADADAAHQFTSGCVSSGGRVTWDPLRLFAPPVRIEASIKWQEVPGLLPAIWMYSGSDAGGWKGGEIDLAEIGIAAGQVKCTAWGEPVTIDPDNPAGYVNPIEFGAAAPLPGAVAIGADYIHHQLDWLDDELTFYVNGEQVLHVTRADFAARGASWPFDRRQFDLIMSIAIPGSGSPASDFTESTMLIDWVKATKL